LPSWHRAASKNARVIAWLPVEGLDGNLLIATAVPSRLAKPGRRKLVRYLAMASDATSELDSSLDANCCPAICLEVMQYSTRRWAAMP
jgi:hypothetical protein